MVRRTGMTVFEDEGLLTIEIAPTRRWSDWGQDAVLLVLWALIGIRLASHMPPLEQADARLISLCAQATLALLCVLGAIRLIWHFWGIEEIVLEGEMLKRIRRLGIVAWSANYEAALVRDLHVTLKPMQFPFIAGGRLAFDYMGRVRVMGDRLSATEAKEVVRVVRGWLPARNWTPVLGI